MTTHRRARSDRITLTQAAPSLCAQVLEIRENGWTFQPLSCASDDFGCEANPMYGPTSKVARPHPCQLAPAHPRHMSHTARRTPHAAHRLRLESRGSWSILGR